MKKVLCFLTVLFFLFCSIAPIFSYAATGNADFICHSPMRESYFNTITGDYESGAECFFGFTNTYCRYIGVKVTGNYSNVDYMLYYSPSNNVPYLRIIINGTSGIVCNYSLLSIDMNTSDVLTSSGRITLTGSSQNVPLIIPGVNNSWYQKTYYVYNLNSFNLSQQDSHQVISNINFVQFSVPAVADYTINSYIPEPHANLHQFYLADSQYLYSYYVNNPTLYYGWYDINGQNGDLKFVQELIPSIQSIGSSLLVQFENNCNYDVDIYRTRYNIISGEYIDSSSLTVTANNNVFEQVAISNNNLYQSIWYDGFKAANNLSDFSLLSIRWSDTIDYTNEFVIVESLIQNLITTINTNSINISGILNSISSNTNSLDINLASLINTFLDYYTWLQNDIWGDYSTPNSPNPDLQFYLRDYMTRFSQFYLIMQFSIVPDLEKIIELMEPTTEPDTSSFQDTIEEYESDEHAIVSFASGALEDAASYIDDAGSVLEINSRGLLFIKQIFENFAFTGLNYYFMLFVLVIGSVALLIGRRMR